jgi:hypothetical protein
MATLRRFGRTVTMPSSIQIRHELRTIVLPDAKPDTPPPPAGRAPVAGKA